MDNSSQRINRHNLVDMWLRIFWKENYKKVKYYRQGDEKSLVVIFLGHVILSMSLYTRLGQSSRLPENCNRTKPQNKSKWFLLATLRMDKFKKIKE